MPGPFARVPHTRVSGPGRMARWSLGCPGPHGLAVPSCFVSWDTQGHCWSSSGWTSEGLSAPSALRGSFLGCAFAHFSLSVSMQSSPYLIACVPIFTRLGLSKDRLLLSFWAHSEHRVTDTAGRSPCSPPHPLCDW